MRYLRCSEWSIVMAIYTQLDTWQYIAYSIRYVLAQMHDYHKLLILILWSVQSSFLFLPGQTAHTAFRSPTRISWIGWERAREIISLLHPGTAFVTFVYSPHHSSFKVPSQLLNRQEIMEHLKSLCLDKFGRPSDCPTSPKFIGDIPYAYDIQENFSNIFKGRISSLVVIHQWLVQSQT